MLRGGVDFQDIQGVSVGGGNSPCLIVLTVIQLCVFSKGQIYSGLTYFNIVCSKIYRIPCVVGHPHNS